MILQLKEKFWTTAERSEQVQIWLCCHARSWTRKKIESEFGVTDYMVQRVSSLHKKKMSFQLPIQNQGPLPASTVKLVAEFCVSLMKLARQCPVEKILFWLDKGVNVYCPETAGIK